MPSRNLISRADRWVLPRQYKLYASADCNLVITLQAPDLSFRTPISVTLAATTQTSLKDLVDTDGAHSEIFDSCIAAYVKNAGGVTVYYGPFLEKDGTTTTGTLGTDCPLFFVAGETVILGAN